MQPQGAAGNDRGQYGDVGHKRDLGIGGLLFVVGISVGVYALSPGAWHWYKHGHLPPARR